MHITIENFSFVFNNHACINNEFGFGVSFLQKLEVFHFCRKLKRYRLHFKSLIDLDWEAWINEVLHFSLFVNCKQS